MAVKLFSHPKLIAGAALFGFATADAVKQADPSPIVVTGAWTTGIGLFMYAAVAFFNQVWPVAWPKLRGAWVDMQMDREQVRTQSLGGRIEALTGQVASISAELAAAHRLLELKESTIALLDRRLAELGQNQERILDDTGKIRAGVHRIADEHNAAGLERAANALPAKPEA